MRNLRFPGIDDLNAANDGPIPFPRPQAPVPDVRKRGSDVLFAFEEVSRRMETLARQLECFGYFDDDDDRPTAA